MEDIPHCDNKLIKGKVDDNYLNNLKIEINQNTNINMIKKNIIYTWKKIPFIYERDNICNNIHLTNNHTPFNICQNYLPNNCQCQSCPRNYGLENNKCIECTGCLLSQINSCKC